MSIVVAHQPSAIGRLAVQEAAYEAHIRSTSLIVIHVSEAVDVELLERQRKGLLEEVEDLLKESDLAEVSWTLQVATGPDTAEEILDLLTEEVELLVIGARRRSPIGKMIMGSVTQTLVLRAEVPVLVVKAAARKLSKSMTPSRPSVR